MGRDRPQLLYPELRENDVRPKLRALECDLTIETLAMPEVVGQCSLNTVCESS